MRHEQSLNRKSLTRFIGCMCALLLLAMPAFYFLTKNFYAEDMADIIEAVGQGRPLPALDFETDIIKGIMLQFVLIVTLMGVAIVVTAGFISRRLWHPFDKTLAAIESFRLEDDRNADLPETDVSEFRRLNDALDRLMRNSRHSYRLQKEFTENASHELQTPLAVFQSKLDLLLQQSELSEQQAAIIQDLYAMSRRLSRLNRNLLLLAKMENRQFRRTAQVDLVTTIDHLHLYLDSLATDVALQIDIKVPEFPLHANSALLESMVSNLVVNAIRHNRPGGTVRLTLTGTEMTIDNTSDEPPLDTTRIFDRFYRPTEQTAGNGLGLAIVKAVCDYHGWCISYSFHSGHHQFCVSFVRSATQNAPES